MHNSISCSIFRKWISVFESECSWMLSNTCELSMIMTPGLDTILIHSFVIHPIMTYWDPIVRCSGSRRYNLDDGVALKVQELIIDGHQVFWKAGALTKVGKKELCWRNTNGWGNRTGRGDALHPKAGKPSMKGRGGIRRRRRKESQTIVRSVAVSTLPKISYRESLVALAALLGSANGWAAWKRPWAQLSSWSRSWRH